MMQKGCSYMKILALDSSGLVASVALITENSMLAEYTVNYKKTHSQTLLPMLHEITAMVDLDLNEIDAIAVSSGPGSFTGLRIGSATAKGLGLALDKPIISVPTLDGMAYQFFGTDKIICPLMDARRNQVYTGLYEFNENKFVVRKEQTATDIEEIIEEINQTGREVIFLGDGSLVYQEIILEKTKVKCHFAPAHMNRQRAGAVGLLAVQYYLDKRIESADEHQPEYLRLSQAERERAEKQNNTAGE